MIQVAANIVFSASGYLLVGLGFFLTYSAAGFFHFAHGAVITVAAYSTFALRRWVGMPLQVAMLGGLVLGAAMGTGLELGVYRPLRRRSATGTGLLLASLGTYLAFQGIVSLIFGASVQSFRPFGSAASMKCLGAQLAPHQIAMIGAAVVACGAVAGLLRATRFGTLIRAVASDPELAAAVGLDRDGVIRGAFLIGSTLGGLSGILLAWDTDMTPSMGFRPLLMGMIAVVVGGIGSIWGALLGALLVATVQHASAYYISSKWQDVIAFVVLGLFLGLKPRGLIAQPHGRREN